MKKIICFAVALSALSLSTAMAAPLNDLARNQTAVGASNDGIYIENKVADKFTLGIQGIDFNKYDSFDIYGQYHFTNNFRGIIGHRDVFDGSLYAGVGVSDKLDDNWDGHAYVVFGDEFAEAQVGANYKINSNLDANVYVRFFMADHGDDHNRLGLGLTYKF